MISTEQFQANEYDMKYHGIDFSWKKYQDLLSQEASIDQS